LDNQDDVKFCVQCGQELPEEASANNPQQQAVPPQNNPIPEPRFVQQTQQNAPQMQQNPNPQYNQQMPPVRPPQYGQVPPQYGQQMPPVMQPQYGNPYQNPGTSPLTPALSILKQIAASPLFMTAVILYTASLIFRLIGSFMPVSSVNNAFISGMIDSLQSSNTDGQLDFFIDSLSNTSSGTSFIGTFLSMIMPVLICIGLWLFYMSSKDTENRSTTGLTIMKTITIIEIVLIFVLVGILLIVSLLAIFAGIFASSNNYLGGGMEIAAGAIVAVFSILIFVVLAVLALVIVYMFAVLKTIRKVINITICGNQERLSMFVAVMNIIFGSFAALSSLFSIMSGIFVFLSGAASAAFTIIIGVGIIQYNNRLSESVFRQPPAAPPQYNPYHPQ